MQDINRISADPAASRYRAEINSLRGVLEGVLFAILYGSLVSGRPRADSDVDLAVMYPYSLSADCLIRLTGEVAAAFSRDADLLDLRCAGPIIKMQVLRYGCPVIVNDPSAFENFRMYTLGEFSDFKLSRRPIEEAIKHGALHD